MVDDPVDKNKNWKPIEVPTRHGLLDLSESQGKPMKHVFNSGKPI